MIRKVTKMMKTHIHPAIALASLIAYFDPGKAGWKTTKLADGTEAVVMQDGNPVWVAEDGAEGVIRSDAIATRNAENKTLRERAEAAEGNLAKYAKITDPDKALEALETVKSLKQGDLLKAGEVEAVKNSMKTEFQQLIDDAKKEAETARTELNSMRTTTAFTTSEFVTKKLAIPADIAQATFEKHTKFEDGKLVVYGADGNKIMSKKKIGEVADFEEGIERFVTEHYPNKDKILVGGNQGGSGNNGGGGGGQPGKSTYKMADFEKLPPAEQTSISAAVREGKAELVD